MVFRTPIYEFTIGAGEAVGEAVVGFAVGAGVVGSALGLCVGNEVSGSEGAPPHPHCPRQCDRQHAPHVGSSHKASSL